MTHHGIWRGLGPFHLFVLSARLVVAPRLLPRKERKVSERQTPPRMACLEKVLAGFEIPPNLNNS